jgi:hypothetical protein
MMPFGSPGSGVKSFASVAALQASSPPSTASAAFAYIGGYRNRVFFWDRLSEITENGINVVKLTSTTIGRWVALDSGHPLAWFEDRWYIDPTDGDDAASGTASNAPIKTMKEFMARLGGKLKRYTVLEFLTAPVSGDPLSSLNLTIEHDTSINSSPPYLEIRGQATADVSSTVTAFTFFNSTTHVYNILNDTGVADFTPHIGKLIRFTATGAIATIIAAPSGNNAHVTFPYVPDTLSFSVPSGGNAYEILSFTNFSGAHGAPMVTVAGGIPADIGTNIQRYTVRYSDITFTLPNGQRIESKQKTFYSRVRFIVDSNVTFTGDPVTMCGFYISLPSSGLKQLFNYCSVVDESTWVGGHVAGDGAGQVLCESKQVMTGVYFRAARYTKRAGAGTVSGCGVWDTTSGAGWESIETGLLYFVGSSNFGNGNTVGAECKENGSFRRGTAPKTTGTTELRMDGQTVCIPAIGAGGGVVPAEVSISTWANANTNILGATHAVSQRSSSVILRA